MDEVSLREATAEDAPSLVDVIHQAFEEYRGRLDPPSGAHDESGESIRQKIATAHAVVAAVNQEIIGCAFYEPDGDHMYFGRLAVLPSYRRQGISRRLIDWIEHQTRSFGFARVQLSVRVVLLDNQAYYERLGYRVLSYGNHAGYVEPTFVNMVKDVA